MLKAMSFARFVVAPENRAAWIAVQDLAGALSSGKIQGIANPLYLHGCSGTGKTHLVSALVDEVACGASHWAVSFVPASDLLPAGPPLNQNLFPCTEQPEPPPDLL